MAVAASIIASQAMISGAFAIISQSQTLGCFPRVRVTHTSTKHEGQVYIPEINYALMIACIIVTAAFQTTEQIGNAYGIAVVFVMFITTLLVTLVMLLIWKTSMVFIFLFLVFFGGAELLYLSSVFYKFTQGGYLPLAFAAVLMFIMSTWHYVHVKRYKFEMSNKVPSNYIRELALRKDLARLPGIGFLYSELVQGIPPILPHLIDKIPSIHSVLVIMSIKFLPISKVEMGERFLFRHVEPKEYKIFRCVVRYGYNDALEESRDFENLLIEHLKEFVYQEAVYAEAANGESRSPAVRPEKSKLLKQNLTNGHDNEKVVSAFPVSGDEVEFVQREMEKGVVYLLGETEVVARRDSGLVKRIIVDYAYNFMRRNFTQGEKVMRIPRDKLLRIGMTYEI